MTAIGRNSGAGWGLLAPAWLLVDLVTVSSYEVDGSQILVPQRVDAERPKVELAPLISQAEAKGYLTEGSDDFAAAIDGAREEHRATLRRLTDWATLLQRERLVNRFGTSQEIRARDGRA
jgi:hypothetical protein